MFWKVYVGKVLWLYYQIAIEVKILHLLLLQLGLL